MQTVHSEPLDDLQLLSLHRGFQRPSNVHSGTCTLCGQHASKLKSHLARHLEQLALFAIPMTDYMATLEQDDTSSNAARQSAIDSVSTESLIGLGITFGEEHSTIEDTNGSRQEGDHAESLQTLALPLESDSDRPEASLSQQAGGSQNDISVEGANTMQPPTWRRRISMAFRRTTKRLTS
jgi:hypothetical protein